VSRYYPKSDMTFLSLPRFSPCHHPLYDWMFNGWMTVEFQNLVGFHERHGTISPLFLYLGDRWRITDYFLLQIQGHPVVILLQQFIFPAVIITLYRHPSFLLTFSSRGNDGCRSMVMTAAGNMNCWSDECRNQHPGNHAFHVFIHTR
jgi:hypothetical protein